MHNRSISKLRIFHFYNNQVNSYFFKVMGCRNKNKKMELLKKIFFENL